MADDGYVRSVTPVGTYHLIQPVISSVSLGGMVSYINATRLRVPTRAIIIMMRAKGAA